MARAGCNSGNARNCARRSGDALKSTQSELSAETAMEDCVRGFALRVPLRTPSQLGQLQFHWGNPPPAADPRTRMRTQVFQGAKTREAPALHGGFCGYRSYRVEQYIEDSKPRRISVYSGLVHIKHLQQFELIMELVLASGSLSRGGRSCQINSGTLIEFAQRPDSRTS